MAVVWHINKTWENNNTPIHPTYLEKNGALVPVDYSAEQLERQILIHAFQDPINDTFCWPSPSEYNFIVWKNLKEKIAWTERVPKKLCLNSGQAFYFHDIDFVVLSIENDDALICVRIELKNGRSEVLAGCENRPVDILHDNMNFDIDAGWARSLANALGAWLGVIVREVRNGVLVSKHLSEQAVLKPEQYLNHECKKNGVILRNHFRVVSDVEAISVKDFDNFFEAKKHADYMIRSYSGYSATIAAIFNERNIPIYLGK